MRKIVLIIALLIFSMLLNANNFKVELAKEILVIQGLSEYSEAFWEKQIEDSKYYDHPNLPDSVWVSVKAEMNEKDTFLNAMAELYADEFSKKELKNLLKILKSDVMVKFRNFEMTSTDKFAMKAMVIGREIPKRITAFLKEKGYINE